MAASLDVLGFTPSQMSSKEAIINLLSRRWPLSARQIFCTLKSEYSFSVSYQSVHKLLSELCKRSILEKKEKNYQLSVLWVNNIKNFGERLDKLYSNKNVIKDFEKDDIINLSFSRFVDFGKFIINVFHEEFPNPDKKACICFLDHAWGPMGLDEKDVKQLELVYAKHKHFGFFKGNSPLDRYFADGMKNIGKICFLGVELPVQGDVLIEGDYICQVFYPPEFMKKFDALYNNNPKVDQAGFIPFFKLYQESHTIRVVITKNARLADYFRDWAFAFEKNERIAKDE